MNYHYFCLQHRCLPYTRRATVLYTGDAKTFAWKGGGGRRPPIKLLNASDYVIVKAGKRYSMQPPVHVRSLVETMERNESYIYWLQPKGGGIEDQFASININGKFYHLNSKLEKAIFRNVRLTKDFRNYETLADGTHKLRIPTRLLKEKIRTSVRAQDCAPVSTHWM